MKFSEKFKKNKSEAVETETAQDSGKKKHKPDPKKLVGTISKKHIKNGTYSMAMAAIFIVIVVVINMIVGAIPSKYSQLDVSSSKLYTIGDETEKVLKALDKDVTIYQIAPSGSEDDTISNLLSRYKDESKHIKVEVKDPVVNPKFASEYTSDDLASNSLIVVCGDRNKVINYNDMYSTSVDYNTWKQTTTGFDGEGQITSAIGYVTSENLPIMYTLSGHGEKDLDSSFKEDIQKANIDIKDLNLLTEGKVPDDADCLMIVSPTSDISEEEKTEILDYLEAGGKAMIFSDYTQDDLPNFDAVLENYGVKRAAGIVFEGDSQHYGMQMPYYLVPTVNSTDASSETASAGSYVLAPYAQGIQKTDDVRDTVTIDSILTTSDQAYSKTNMQSSNIEKEDGDVDGPFDLGVAITEKLDDDKETQIVYYSTANLMESQVNQMVSGGNEKLIKFLNDVKYSFNSYTLNQTVLSLGVQAIKDREYFEETCAKVIATREWTKCELKKLGFSFGDSMSNFIFATHERVPAKEIFEVLREHNIFVRYFSKPRISNYLRISIGTQQEMERLTAFLAVFLGE